MLEFLLILTAVSVLLISYFAFRFSVEQSSFVTTVKLSTIFFCVWVVCTAFFGSYFFVIRPAGFFDITIDRILLIGILLVLLVGLFDGNVNIRENATIEVLMAFFSLVCLVSMMRYGFKSTAPQFPSPWNVFIIGYLFPFFAFAFAKYYLISEKDMDSLFYTLFYIGVYISVIAPLEFFNLRQYVFPQFINDPTVWLHLERARGPFLNAAFNGVALNIGYISGIYLFPRKTGFSKLYHLFFLFLYFPAIFFTQTRSVYLGFLIVNMALIAFYQTRFAKWKILPIPIIIVLVIFLVNIPKMLSADRREGGVLQVQEVEVRMGLIRRSIVMILDQPFLGVGLAQFIPAAMKEYRGRVQVAEGTTQQTQHNHIIGMLVELGLVGAGFYFLIVFFIFRRLYKLTFVVVESSWVSSNTLLLIAASMIVYLMNNLFVEPSFCLFINSVFFIFGGLADGLYNKFVLEA